MGKEDIFKQLRDFYKYCDCSVNTLINFLNSDYDKYNDNFIPSLLILNYNDKQKKQIEDLIYQKFDNKVSTFDIKKIEKVYRKYITYKSCKEYIEAKVNICEIKDIKELFERQIKDILSQEARRHLSNKNKIEHIRIKTYNVFFVKDIEDNLLVDKFLRSDYTWLHRRFQPVIVEDMDYESYIKLMSI